MSRNKKYTVAFGVDTGAARRDLDKLDSQARSARATMDHAQRATIRAQRAADKYAASTKTLSRNQDSASRSTKKATRETRDMGSAANTAANKTDKATTSTRKLDRAQEGLGATVKKVGVRFLATVATIGTLTAATAQVSRAVTTFASFEQQMAQVQAVSQATDEQWGKLKAQARDLGATTRFSASEAAAGQEFLARAGFDTTKILASMPAVLDVASAAQLDLGTAADITSNILSSYQLPAEESSRVTDVLAASASSANTDVTQMGEAFKFAGPVASALKIPIESTAAAIGIMSNAGLQASMSGTGLRRILASLVNPSKQGAKAIAEMGLSVSDLDPRVHSITEIVRTFADTGLDAGDAMEIFGQRGGPAILALVSQVEELEDLDTKLQDVEGTARRMAETMENTVAGAGRSLRSAWESLQIELGEALVPALRSTAATLTELARSEEAAEFARQMGENFGLAVTIMGGLIEHADLLKFALIALTGVALNSWITGGTKALRLMTLASFDLGGAIKAVRAGYGGLVALELKSVFAGWSASARRLTASLALMTATLAGVLALNAAVEAWSDKLSRDIDAIAQSAREAGVEWNNLRDQIREGLVDPATIKAVQAEVRTLAIDINKVETALNKELEATERLQKQGLVGENFASSRAIELERQLDTLKRQLATKQKLLLAARDVKQKEEETAEATGDIFDNEEGISGELDAQAEALEAQAEGLANLQAEISVQLDLMRATSAEREIILTAQELGIDLEMRGGDLAREQIKLLLQIRENYARILELEGELNQSMAETVDSAAALRHELGSVEFPDPQAAAAAIQDAVDGDLADQIEAMNDQLIEQQLAIAGGGGSRANDDLRSAWVELGQTVAQVASQMHEGLGQVVGQAVSIVQGLQGVKSGANAAERAIAGMGVGLGVSGIAQSLGLFKGQRGTGSFGGQLSGDYSEIGGAVGGAIGSFFGPVGTVVGSVLGTALGGAIKSGADEGLAELQLAGDEVGVRITKMEGGLGDVIGDLGQQVADSINSVMDRIGGEIAGLPGVEFKIRDDVVTVFVNGMRRQFSEVSEAAGFAIAQALRTAEVTGISPTVQAALRDRANDNVETLFQNIADAIKIDDLGLSEVAVRTRDSLRGISIEFDRLIDKAIEWELGMESFRKLGSELFAGGFREERDAITGVVRDEREIFEDRRAIYNAELTLKKNELETEAEALRMRIELARQHLEVQEANLTAEQQFLRGLGEFAQGIGLAAKGIGATAAFTQGTIEAWVKRLAALDAALENLPDIISADEFRPRGGGGRRQRQEAFDSQIDRIERSLEDNLSQALAELATTFDELAEEARRLGRSEERVLELRRQRAEQLADEKVRDPLREFQDPSEGGTFGLSDEERREQEIRERFAEIREANERILEQEGVLGATREEILEAEQRAMNQLAESVVSQLGLPMERLRERTDRMAETLRFLRRMVDEGALSAERFGEVFAQMQAQAQTEILTLTERILESMGRSEEAAEVRAALQEAEFLMQVAQLNFLIEHYNSLGLLTDELNERLTTLLGIINDPENWPDFTPVETDRRPRPRPRPSSPDPPANDNTPAANDNLFDPDTLRTQEITNQIQAWQDLANSAATDKLGALRDRFLELLPDIDRLGISMDDFRDSAIAAAEALAEQAQAPLRSLRNELTEGDRSGLSPEERLGRTEEHLANAFEAALENPTDEAAIRRFDTMARALLNRQEEFSAGESPLLAQRREEILAMIAAIEAIEINPLPETNDQAAEEQRQQRQAIQQLVSQIGNQQSSIEEFLRAEEQRARDEQSADAQERRERRELVSLLRRWLQRAA